jgi:hypothetical protein
MIWEAKTGSTCVWHSYRFATFSFEVLSVVESFWTDFDFGRRHLCAHTSFALGQAIFCTRQASLFQPTNSMHFDREARDRIGCSNGRHVSAH